MVIFAVYAATGDEVDPIKEMFYEEFQSAMDETGTQRDYFNADLQRDKWDVLEKKSKAWEVEKQSGFHA